MKKNFNYSKYLAALFSFLLLACSPGKEDHSGHRSQSTPDSIPATRYTCPMHPEINSDTPGVCPKCFMDLEAILPPKKIDTLSYLIQPTDHLVISGMKSIKPSVNKGYNRLEALGYLTYNPELAKSISARASGRIEKLYVKYNFQKVYKGQKLMELYSPELQSAQSEYLNEISTLENNESIRNSIVQKLLNLGMTDSDIKRIEITKQINASIPIYATHSGHLHFLSGSTDIAAHGLSWPSSTKTQSTPQTSSSDPMGAVSMEKNEAKSVLKEGDYVQKGNLLFTIASESGIWALFKILPSDIPFVQTGNEVDVIVNNETHSGKIDFIEKSFDGESDFYTVRVYLNCNDHSHLRIGSLIRGYLTMKSKAPETLWIPALSVLDMGKSKSAVFVKEALGYSAKEIRTGKRMNDWVEVQSGLNAEDSIAPVAAYLVDSEAFVKTK